MFASNLAHVCVSDIKNYLFKPCALKFDGHDVSELLKCQMYDMRMINQKYHSILLNNELVVTATRPEAENYIK